jgi:hypothetical protein
VYSLGGEGADPARKARLLSLARTNAALARYARHGHVAAHHAREPHHVTRTPTLPLRVMRDSPLT